MSYIIHPHLELRKYWGEEADWDISNFDNLRAAVIERYGPFPLLFETNGTKVPLAENEAGLVIIDLIELPVLDRSPQQYMQRCSVSFAPGLGERGTNILFKRDRILGRNGYEW